MPGSQARFDPVGSKGGPFVLVDQAGEVEAQASDQVVACLDQVEDATRRGLWAAGFVSYEAAEAFDPKFRVSDGRSGPLLWFGLYERRVAASEVVDQKPWFGRPLSSDWDRDAHALAIEEAKRLILGGYSYQVNLTTRFRGSVYDPWSLYRHLIGAQRGDLSAFLMNDEVAIACASPELFFEVNGTRITTRPMKGTSRRGRFEEEDRMASVMLRSSPKERAENVMITDMCRNDLGRIAVPGTVRVPKLLSVEPYPSVWQMTSTVVAELREPTSLAEIFAALFPPASVTGAPRHETMQAIARIEEVPRGVYCGAVGYVAPCKSGINARFAVAIRTAQIDLATRRAVYGSGSGVTWGSTSSSEWDELRDKAAILGEPYRIPGLFETMKFESGDLPELVDRHLDRIENSSAFFEIPFDRVDAIEQLRIACKDCEARSRIRLVLTGQGEIFVEVQPFPEQVHRTVRLAIARDNVDSTDLLLRHKVTDRSRYAQLLVPGADDVLLHNENRQITETTIANVLFRIGRDWYTPPVECGLLPGVERSRLLESGSLKERVLLLDEIPEVAEIALVNALRGWRKAVLVGS